MLKMPIVASIPAPNTGDRPWSEQAAIRCVPMRPLVVAPQMKKAPASSQKSRLCDAIFTTSMACAERVALRRLGRRRLVGGAVRAQAELLGPVAQEHHRERRDHEERGRAHERRRRAPAVVLDQPRQQRQEDQLPGRERGAQQADHEAAARDEPAVRDDRRQRDRDRARRRCRRARPRARRTATGCPSPASGPRRSRRRPAPRCTRGACRAARPARPGTARRRRTAAARSRCRRRPGRGDQPNSSS